MAVPVVDGALLLSEIDGERSWSISTRIDEDGNLIVEQLLSENPTIKLSAINPITDEDGLSKGIEFEYSDGSQSRLGFFGYDDTSKHLVYLIEAVSINGQITGTPGVIQAGQFRGDLVGTADTARNIEGGAAGSVFYQSAPSVTEILPAGTPGQVLITTGNSVEWGPPIGLQGAQGIQGTQGTQGTQGRQGIQGSVGPAIRVIGSVEDVNAVPPGDPQELLNNAFPGPTLGDGVIDEATGDLWVFNSAIWVNVGQLVGPQGEQGLQGIQGIQGLRGFQGIQGISIQGTQGPIGIQGNVGIQGPVGSQGIQGVQGSQGIQGTTGTRGSQGIQGIQGSTGIQGTQGRQGITGATGPQGIQGSTGIQGSIGVQGSQGIQGTQGIRGQQGIQGLQGLSGFVGGQGIQGRQGIQGIIGAQGIQGISGSVGAQGTQGRQGITGTFSTNQQLNSLGVGTSASGSAGEIRATSNITSYFSSDQRYKTNVKAIENAADIVSEIGGKTFDWTDEYIKTHGGDDGYFVRKHDFGVIAQDVQKAFPKAVRVRPDNSLAVDYPKMVALAFAAIAELNEKVKKLSQNQDK